MKKKLLTAVVLSVIIVAIALASGNTSSEKSELLISNLNALASGESNNNTSCNTGNKNSAYAAQRYCGDCKLWNLQTTGDGTCKK